MQKQAFILFTLWVLFWIIVSGKRIPSYAGPYRVIIRRVNNDTHDFNSTGNFWIRLHVTHPKLREAQYVWGWSYNAKELTDEFRGEARMSIRSNNQWKKNAFVMKLDRACSNLFFHAKPFVDLLFEPKERKCPLPKWYGLREIKNQSFEATFPQFPVMPYGRYRFALAFIKNDQTEGLMVADVDIVPRV